MTTPYRIYFDCNEGDDQGRYDLGIPGSLRDIAAFADRLVDGMVVVIYMNDEVEMEAALQFDHNLRRWMAVPRPGTIRYPKDLS